MKTLNPIIFIRHKYFIELNSSSFSNKYTIPYKIKRNELSVLYALAGTVKPSKITPSGHFYHDILPISSPHYYRKLVDESIEVADKFISDFSKKVVSVADDEPKVNSLIPLVTSEQIKIQFDRKILDANQTLSMLINLCDHEQALIFYSEHKEFNFTNSVKVELFQLAAFHSTFHKYFEICEALFNDLEKTKSVYTTMLLSYAKIYNSDKLIDVYKNMKKANMKLTDIKIYTDLFRGFAKNTDPKPLIYFHNEAIKNCNAKPDCIYFNNLFYGFQQANQLSIFNTLFEQMKKLEIVPNLGIYAHYIRNNGFIETLKVLSLLEDRTKLIDYEVIKHPDDLDLFEVLIGKNDRYAKRIFNLLCSGGRFHLLDKKLHKLVIILTMKIIKNESMDNADTLKALEILSQYNIEMDGYSSSMYLELLIQKSTNDNLSLEEQIEGLCRIIRTKIFRKQSSIPIKLINEIISFSKDLEASLQLKFTIKNAVLCLLEQPGEKKHSILMEAMDIVLYLKDPHLYNTYLRSYLEKAKSTDVVNLLLMLEYKKYPKEMYTCLSILTEYSNEIDMLPILKLISLDDNNKGVCAELMLENGNYSKENIQNLIDIFESSIY